MAEYGASDEGGKKNGGLMQTVAAVAILTLVAGGGGALMGKILAKPGPAEPPATPVADGPAPESAADPATSGNTDEAAIKGLSRDGHPVLKLVPLEPVLTNIYAPSNTWLRVEASLIVRDDGSENAAVLAAEVQADTLAFLRSVQLAQIEGTRGLMHLRDDLRERAKLRSPAVVDYLLKSLVAE